jgi:class 3 adenylate cyclase
MASNQPPGIVTFLFTDIEGSTRLWAQEPERMRVALARHDVLARAAIEGHNGTVVKMTGDGVHAAFRDPVDAVSAALRLQQAMADPQATNSVALPVRCGLHLGVVERRDNDYFGSAVNRVRDIAATSDKQYEGAVRQFARPESRASECHHGRIGRPHRDEHAGPEFRGSPARHKGCSAQQRWAL